MSYFVREVNIIYAPLLFGLSISKLQVGLLSWYNHNLEFMFQPNDSYISWGYTRSDFIPEELQVVLRGGIPPSEPIGMVQIGSQ